MSTENNILILDRRNTYSCRVLYFFIVIIVIYIELSLLLVPFGYFQSFLRIGQMCLNKKNHFWSTDNAHASKMKNVENINQTITMRSKLLVFFVDFKSSLMGIKTEGIYVMGLFSKPHKYVRETFFLQK